VQYHDYNDFFYPRLQQRGKRHLLPASLYSCEPTSCLVRIKRNFYWCCVTYVLSSC